MTAIALIVGSFVVSDTPTISLTSEKTKSAREEHKRQGMLELVKDSWVNGVLKPSLHGEVLIELGLGERKDAVLNQQGIELQRPGHPNHLLPPGKKIMDVFDELGQTMLIMGEPGSGKTTMLLELARDTIARAEEDPPHRIPVVFNLSSWTDAKQPIADWLVGELITEYYIPKETASDWIKNDEMLLLLDGLDEVLPERREACARAINDFRHEHGLTPLVVCCRSEEYDALTDRLDLKGAFCLQPLTENQVDEYLDRIGPELAALRTTLKDDPTLYKLAQTPLMLSIMTLAYRGMSVHDLRPLETIDARRKHIFDNYVERMFKPRTHRTILDVSDDPRLDYERFSKEKIIHWLSWLAKRMSQNGQTIFLIEKMQPDWLPTRAQRWIMAIGVGGMIGLLYGLIACLILVILTGLPLFDRSVVVLSLLSGLILGQFLELDYMLSRRYRSIHPIEMLRFSWPTIVTMALGVGLLAYLSTSLSSMFVCMLLLFSGLHIAVYAGLTKGEIDARTVPNEGVYRSARNALYAFIVFGSLLGLSFALITWLRPWMLWLPGPFVVFVFVLFATGLPAGLHLGGRACIQHYVLRIMLRLNGSAPLNYVRFLDYAAGRIFLRKVGGGYIFVHRLLLEYFASLEPEEEGG
ncbi:MAG: NACHT domain-containing protein [Methanosarcinales archaeon]|nr:NACHT domain-containing protein [Methanosarcinales archaeon]